MTTEVFLSLLTCFSALTTAVVEYVKKILNEKNVEYSSNIVACIVAAVLGLGGTFIFYSLTGAPISYAHPIYMAIATALCAMCGYDKIKGIILQLRDIRKE